MTAEQLLEKAGVQLLFGHPFWATGLYQLQRGRVPVGPEVCEIGATDGKSLFYNPPAVAKLPLGQAKTFLAHEACHVLLHDHIWMRGKDPQLANMAADHVNNNILLESGFEPIPGWLCDARFKGLTKDQAYQILEKERMKQPQGGGGKQPPPQQPQAGGGKGKPKTSPPGGQQPRQKPGQGQQPGPGQAAQTPGGFGQIMPCPDEEVTQQEAQWKMAVETAVVAARKAGKMPGHMMRLVEELREAKLDWRELLRTFVANTIPSDFTWARPSRRTLSQGLYLPSQTKEGLGEIIYALDASGSIASKELNAFAGEVNSIHTDLKPQKTTVLYHDTKVYGGDEFGPADEVEFHPKGGGGTDFRCVFDWIDQQGPPPKCLVFFTDLCGSFPKYSPDYPVLWVSITKDIAPFGETVRLEA